MNQMLEMIPGFSAIKGKVDTEGLDGSHLVKAEAIIQSMTKEERVRRHREFQPDFIPLPHPAWRSTLFMRQHPWFEEDLLPVLRDSVAAALRGD